MSYREYGAAVDLRDYVACTWTQTLTQPARQPIDIIPDGCVDLVLIEGQPIHVAGPATTTQLVQPTGRAIIGLRLRPGAARAVLGCPANRLLDQDSDLIAVCGRAARVLEHGVSDDPHATRRALEQWVRGRLERMRQPPTALLAATLISSDPRVSLDLVLQRCELSARTLHRELSASCGYGPKLLQRIMRMQHTLRAATGAVSLAELAATMGYADQAHMTRDFRSLTGKTPARYLATCNGEVGRWLESRDMSDSFNRPGSARASVWSGATPWNHD